MTKRIAVVNDLSGFGRCSLTAAISVIAAMGVQPCPLPTAILSAQTGYPSYFYDDYTDKMAEIQEEWKKMSVRFDGIYMGFMSGCRQIGRAIDFLETFQKEDTFLLVDPIMGDNGARFEMFSPGFQKEMKRLVKRADIITPNLTELCLLADADPGLAANREDAGAEGDGAEKAGGGDNGRKIVRGAAEIVETAEKLARHVMQDGPKEVVVTGIRFRDSLDGREMMGNLAVTKDRAQFFAHPFIGEGYSGTGDLFASVIAGGKARGDSLAEDVELAGEMIALAIQDSVRDHVPRDEGAEYEKYLPKLMKSVFVGEPSCWQNVRKPSV